MIDPQLLRANAEDVALALSHRGYQFDVERYRRLETRRRDCQVEVENLQAERNRESKNIGRLKAEGQDIGGVKQRMAALGARLKSRQQALEAVQSELSELFHEIPNLPHASVPVGRDEGENLEIRRWGEPREFDFETRDHVELGQGLGQMDFDAAVKIAGTRFVVMRADLARLHRALIQFMLDLHIREHGYTEVYVPYLVNRASLTGTGQLPKFEHDQFRTAGEEEFFLVPTGEVPVTNIARDSILDAAELPRKWVTHTPCFRREAGSYGRDTRGMIRQHQFEKVELVQIVHPDESWRALEALTGHAEAVLQQLELPYRVVSLCTGDLGFSAAKTYDLEVWLPAQQAYREISSCSNFESFQARRMRLRWRDGSGKPQLAHTLNGSGLAVGRTLVAILENYQQADGSVTIPDKLWPYMCETREIVLKKGKEV